MERGGTMGHDISSDVATYGQPATRWRGDVSVLGNVERSHRRSQIVGCSRFVVGCTSDRRGAVSAVSSGHLANAGTRALNDRVEEFQFRPNNWRVAIVISAIGSVANQTRIIEYCVGVHHLPCWSSNSTETRSVRCVRLSCESEAEASTGAALYSWFQSAG